MTFAMIVHLELRARLRRWRFYATLGLLIAILAAATRLTAASYQPPSLREYEGRPELAMMQQHFADLEPQRLADRDRAVFAVFVHLQGLAVLLIAPLFAATAIATERERHTLEPLLLTDLRNGEIILGRWLVRLILLGLLLLAGLPVLFASGFVVGRAGGVPAGTFWAATAMVAALSIFALGIGVLALTVSRGIGAAAFIAFAGIAILEVALPVIGTALLAHPSGLVRRVAEGALQLRPGVLAIPPAGVLAPGDRQRRSTRAGRPRGLARRVSGTPGRAGRRPARVRRAPAPSRRAAYPGASASPRAAEATDPPRLGRPGRLARAPDGRRAPADGRRADGGPGRVRPVQRRAWPRGWPTCGKGVRPASRTSTHSSWPSR